jgi:hypothetical protein
MDAKYNIELLTKNKNTLKCLKSSSHHADEMIRIVCQDKCPKFTIV